MNTTSKIVAIVLLTLAILVLVIIGLSGEDNQVEAKGFSYTRVYDYHFVPPANGLDRVPGRQAECRITLVFDGSPTELGDKPLGSNPHPGCWPVGRGVAQVRPMVVEPVVPPTTTPTPPPTTTIPTTPPPTTTIPTTPPPTTTPPPPVVTPTPEDTCEGGNPGNIKCVGNAGEDPNGAGTMPLDNAGGNGNGEHGNQGQGGNGKPNK